MLTLTPELITRHDVSGPRYTSYPTADQFQTTFGPTEQAQALSMRRLGIGSGHQPLSVYAHLPFCRSLCYYCACNKIVTKQYDKATNYLDHLLTELELTVDLLGKRESVAQVHLGGGTPTYYHDDDLTRLTRALQEAFDWQEEGEFAVEIDPRTVTYKRLHHLKLLGYNRLSFGVQDLDPLVQEAVHRVQSVSQVRTTLDHARALGFESINLDLIYGLPHQTPERFEQTLRSVVAMRPDRLAIYGYAHLPLRFKPQRRIDEAVLPDARNKIAMLALANHLLQDAGYVYIGMDHFALPNDSLSVAKRQGRLHRNFQGYSTQPDGDLVALGVSAIGRMGPSYSQNVKTLDAYAQMLSQGQLPVERGYRLTREDLLRRAVIMCIMCQGRVDMESIESAHLIDFKRHFHQELKRLGELQEQGLVVVKPREFEVTELGWFFVRAVAMAFDAHLQNSRERQHRFSRIL